MAIIIRHKTANQNRKEHPLCKYYGFTDSEGTFFLITESNAIVAMNEYFFTYNLNNEYNTIEEFFENENTIDTTFVRAYRTDDFNITIDLM